MPKTLREYRKLNGLSTDYVAKKLMIKPRTLNDKERNNKFTAIQLSILCDLYKIDASNVKGLNKIH